jgi:hypothetical protein
MPHKLSHDQKRKQKLARRTSRAEGPGSPLAHPERYRTEEHVRAVMAAETGILMAYVTLDRQITDHQVEEAVRALVRELRAGREWAGEEPLDVRASVEEPDALIAWAIKSEWQRLYAGRPRPSAEVLEGILGVVLRSIDCWYASGRGPRAYLEYLEPFLGHLGVYIEHTREPALRSA